MKFISLRNIIYAIGNSRKKEYIKLLEGFRGHSVDYISEAADWSISELKNENTQEVASNTESNEEEIPEENVSIEDLKEKELNEKEQE